MRRVLLQGNNAGKAEHWSTFSYADLITQAYFQVLRRNIPNEHDDFIRSRLQNYFERLLLFHIRELNEALCEMARAGRCHACAELWDQASNLTKTFCEIALKKPEPFKRKARLALMMPSLRVPPALRKSRNGRDKWIDPFVGDAPEIAKKIELSADTVGAKISDNRVLLGRLCARLVGQCVHEIKQARALWCLYFTPYYKIVPWPTTREIQPFTGQTHDQLIVSMMRQPDSKMDSIEKYLHMFCLQKDCGVKRLHFLLLPELALDQAKIWWRDAIEKMVEEEFDSLLENPVWFKELWNASKRTTKADMLKELKDYSREKVKQFS